MSDNKDLFAPLSAEELAEIEASRQAKTVQDSPLQTAKDLLMGAAQGVTFGGADEGVAALQATKDLLTGGDLSKYREYQQALEGQFKEAQDRSPIAYNVGEIGSGVATGLLTGGAGLTATAANIGKVGAKEAAKQIAKAAGKGAIVGATAGGLSSEGNLSDVGSADKLVSDIAAGGALGGAFTAGLQGAGSALDTKLVKDYVEDSPFLRQVKRAFQEGTKGREISGGERTQAALLAKKQAQSMRGVEEILDIDSKLGKNIENVLKKADLNPKNQVTYRQDDISLFEELAKKMNETSFRSRLSTNQINPTEMFDLLSQANTPSKANELRKKLYKLADGYAPDSDEAIQLKDAANRITRNLESSVPQYKEANKLFNDFRTASSETIISEGTPVKYRKNQWYGDLKDKENKLFKEIGGMYDEMNRGGHSADTAKHTFNEFMDHMKAFEIQNKGELQKLGINLDVKDMKKKAMDRGDYFALSKRVMNVDPTSNPSAKNLLSTKESSTTRGVAYGAANLAGRTARTVMQSKASPANWSRKLYNATEDKLMGIGENLMSNPSTQKQGQALVDAINSKNLARKNAALFTIAQMPTAREIVKSLMPDIDEE